MFVGYQKDLPVFIRQTKEELKNIPYVVLDEIKEVSFAEMYNGVIYLSAEELTTAKQEYIRSIRNNYLVEYVDGAVSNPLRWTDMSQELKDMYTNYRQYLLDYTKQENWWEKNPFDFNSWKGQNNEKTSSE